MQIWILAPLFHILLSSPGFSIVFASETKSIDRKGAPSHGISHHVYKACHPEPITSLITYHRTNNPMISTGSLTEE